MTRVGLVMPALDEEQALPLVLAELPRSRRPIVVVVDNGSTDRTAEVAREGGGERDQRPALQREQAPVAHRIDVAVAQLETGMSRTRPQPIQRQRRRTAVDQPRGQLRKAAPPLSDHRLPPKSDARERLTPISPCTNRCTAGTPHRKRKKTQQIRSKSRNRGERKNGHGT